MPSPLVETTHTTNAPTWSFTGQTDKALPARRIPICRFPFKIGREPDLGLTINCRCVSKQHAEVTKHNDLLFLRDLGSTNGTYINGDPVIGEQPLKDGDVVQFGVSVFRLGLEALPEGISTTRQSDDDRALATMQFDRLLRTEAVIPLYQPIVALNRDQEVVGYEVLGRSDLFGLQMPAQMFAIASQLGMEIELSRMLRRRGLDEAAPLSPDINLFTNTHPRELADAGFADLLRGVRSAHPRRRITLEIHESAVTEIDQLLILRALLAELDIGLAFDGFGAGQDRLIELCDVTPDFLKFDLKLTHGIDQASDCRQRLVAALVDIVKSIGCVPLAEGVEDEATHQVLLQVGFELGQGHYYGKPVSISKCIAQSNVLQGDRETSNE